MQRELMIDGPPWLMMMLLCLEYSGHQKHLSWLPPFPFPMLVQVPKLLIQLDQS